MKRNGFEKMRKWLAWILTVAIVLSNLSTPITAISEESDVVVQTETIVETETSSQTDSAQTDTTSQTGTTSQTDTTTQTETASQTDAETQTETTEQTGTASESGTEIQTEALDQAATETETGSETAAETGTDSAANSEEETEAQTELTPDSGSDTETDSESEMQQTDESESETETETENTEAGGVLSTLDVTVTQEIFLDTDTDGDGNENADESEDTDSEEDSDADSFYAVKYTLKIKNTSTDTDAEDVSVKVVFGENLTWYEREDDETVISVEDQTDAWYFIEDIRDLSGVPSQYDLDELTEYAKNSTDSEKALEPYASAVVWVDQKIAAGEEEEYVFYAAIKEGITTTDELPALYFVAGEQVVNTAEDQNVIQWKNESLLAENETEAETETETELETETEAETGGEAETESESEIETETEIEMETEIETESESETESETEEAYNFIVYEVSEGGEICLTYTDGYTESITPYMMSDDYDIEVNMPVTEPVEVSVTAYDGYAYVCAVVLDEEGNTIASYGADTTSFTVTANAEYKTTVQVTFAEADEAYTFSEEMLAVASYELLAAAAAEDDLNTLQGQINALSSEYDTQSGVNTASNGGVSVMALVDENTTSGTEIVLDQNYTEDLVIWDDVKVTIDLNGYTITPAGTDKNAVTVYGTLILQDSSSSAGGAVKNTNSLTNIRGVIVAQGGSFTMEGGTISGFSVSGNGGGVLVENGGKFAMTGGTVDSNSATGYGGGMFLYEADQIASITGGIISGNTAGLSGGGLAANLTSSGTVTLNSGLTISGNTSSGYGGGFYFNNAITTLTISSTISGNTSTSEGGGVYFGAAVTTLNMVDATIDGNTSGAAGGGAYFAVAVTSATISGSSLSGNQAAGNGGGIWLNAGTSLTLEDSENNTSTSYLNNVCK